MNKFIFFNDKINKKYFIGMKLKKKMNIIGTKICVFSNLFLKITQKIWTLCKIHLKASKIKPNSKPICTPVYTGISEITCLIFIVVPFSFLRRNGISILGEFWLEAYILVLFVFGHNVWVPRNKDSWEEKIEDAKVCSSAIF